MASSFPLLQIIEDIATFNDSLLRADADTCSMAVVMICPEHAILTTHHTPSFQASAHNACEPAEPARPMSDDRGNAAYWHGEGVVTAAVYSTAISWMMSSQETLHFSIICKTER